MMPEGLPALALGRFCALPAPTGVFSKSSAARLRPSGNSDRADRPPAPTPGSPLRRRLTDVRITAILCTVLSDHARDTSQDSPSNIRPLCLQRLDAGLKARHLKCRRAYRFRRGLATVGVGDLKHDGRSYVFAVKLDSGAVSAPCSHEYGAIPASAGWLLR